MENKKSFFGKIFGKKASKIEIKTSNAPRKELTLETPNLKNCPVKTVDEKSSDDWGTKYDGQLAIDVFQTENEIVIKSTIAGVKPEDVDITIDNDMITIKGERKTEEKISKDNYFYQECYWGSFSRSVILPCEIETDKIAAEIKNGVLTVHLPKVNKTKTRKVTVKAVS